MNTSTGKGKKIVSTYFHHLFIEKQDTQGVLPKFQDWGDSVRWMGRKMFLESSPIRQAYFLQRKGEDPTRMFARGRMSRADQQTISLCIIGHAG